MIDRQIDTYIDKDIFSKGADRYLSKKIYSLSKHLLSIE